ncbi:MAG: DUF2283 domain-containing protein [Dehalococcoidia bacterium]
MFFTYDPEADAIYVEFAEANERSYGERVDEQRIVHRDEAGACIGVEFLFVSRGLNLDGMPEADRVRDLLRSIPQPASA